MVHWITNFLINRTIRIHYKGQTSDCREIHKKVPQGSSLGPILFNYKVKNIIEDHMITNTNTMMYADDILIVHLGEDFEQIQATIDQSIDLSLSPEKCTCMHVISPLIFSKTVRKFELKGKTIPETKITGILRVPINEHLKLDISDTQTSERLTSNARVLNLLNQLKIINPQHWRVLIESFIRSTCELNFVPILAIDKKARSLSENAQITQSNSFSIGLPTP